MPLSPSTSYLAIDLGASSGRAVLGELEDGVMHLEELYRFRTPLVEQEGRLRWNIEQLTSEVFYALELGLKSVPALRSISVDSWGVDYVPLDEQNQPVRDVYAYRDPRTRGRMDEVSRLIGAATLYDITGIQFLDINTLPQIRADVVDEPELLARTKVRLLIADYLLYRLSGVAVAERTLASTTQVMRIHDGEWSGDILDRVGDNLARWPSIVAPGSVLGPVTTQAMTGRAVSAAGKTNIPLVVATCSHDTAAAVAAIPADEGVPWIFISSGTWSLVGAELDKPVLTTSARNAGFTNEAGLDNSIRFLKNRMGMWVFEECAREWNLTSDATGFSSLLVAAEDGHSSGATLDLDAPEFARRGDMLSMISAACRASGIAMPREREGIVRLIFDSMAASYARAVAQLDALLGRRSQVIHVVGGGARVRLLNQLTAQACERRVIAGPYEATALGNLLTQARALGELPKGMSIRQVAARSSSLQCFEPIGRAERFSSAAQIN